MPPALRSTRAKWAVALGTVVFVFCLSVYAAMRQSGGRDVTLRWDYDYQTPPCPMQPHGFCLDRFQVYLDDKGERKGSVFVGNRFDEAGRVISKRLTASLRVHDYGRLTFCVVAIARSENGRSIESLPLCQSKFVLPGFSGKKE